MEERKGRYSFQQMVSIAPDEQLKLEAKDGRITTRIMDLFCPIGKGTRGLIVAPPRTGKTTLLHDIAHGVIENHPNATLSYYSSTSALRRSPTLSAVSMPRSTLRPMTRRSLITLVLPKSRSSVPSTWLNQAKTWYCYSTPSRDWHVLIMLHLAKAVAR